MKKSQLGRLAIVAIVALVLAAGAPGLSAQNQDGLSALAPANLAKPRPKPPFDLTGAWLHSGNERFDPPQGFVLTPEAQREHVAGHPGVFVPAAGAWGARGCTYVVLAGAGRRVVGRALKLAWENVAPEALVAELVGKKKPGSTPERSRGRRSARGSRG